MVQHLIPLPPSPSIVLPYPFNGYPFLCRLPGGDGYALAFLEYRDDPRLEGSYTEKDLECSDWVVHLPGDIGVSYITRCGSGWMVYTVPFSGVHFRGEGSLLGVYVDKEERFRTWLKRLENAQEGPHAA